MLVFFGAVICFVTAVIYNWPFLSLPLFFAVNLVRSFLLPNAQVRISMAIQLGFILFCILVSTISYRKKTPPEAIPGMKNTFAIIWAACAIGTLVGLLRGSALFNIVADNYTLFEILLFFFLIHYTIRSTGEVRTVFKVLLCEMICFGIFELFTKERGGTGLNICMHFIYIFICCGFYKRTKVYWPVIAVSILMIFLCQTRTYMVAAILATLFVFLLSHGHRKQVVLMQYIVLVIALLVTGLILLYSGNTTIQNIVNRILEVRSLGFEAGGYRIYEMNYALQLFRENPVFGTGLGFRRITTLPLMGTYEFGAFLHVSYSGILMKLGIVGGGILLYGFIRYLISQHRLIRRNENAGYEEVVYVLIGGFAGTVSWIIIYLAAPFTGFGSMFIPGIFSMLYSELYSRESEKGMIPADIL